MSVGRHVLAGVVVATCATAGCAAASGADRVTLEPATTSATVRSAPARDVLLRTDAGSPLSVAVGEAIDAAGRERDRAAAAAKAAEKKAQEAAEPRREKPETTTGSGGDCAQRAMAAGKFDPSCSAYQGYLDPGTSAGRAPSSGEIQMRFACEQGLVPRSEC